MSASTSAERGRDTLATLVAPVLWGTTYLVTTEWLPANVPMTLAMLRALPAGLLLMAATRSMPSPLWMARSLVLGALNFSLFWSLLFVAAYRLPGGVAATLGAMQALVVVVMARLILHAPMRPLAIAAAVGGVAGVGLLVLGPRAALDPIGVAAGLGGALAWGTGTVLSRKWQPPVAALPFTAWQLVAGGLLLLPLAWWLEPALPRPSLAHLAGYLWLGVFGAAISYWLWFRGIARIGPGAASMLAMASPLTAMILGWFWLDQALTLVQGAGAALVLGAIWVGQRAHRTGPSRGRA
ncbi:MAG: EamA family transporter [Burkholderiaceae bacterium]